MRDVALWEGSILDALWTERVGKSVAGSLLLAFTTAIGGALIGVPAAYFLARYKLPFSKVWVILFTLPLVFPSYISAYSYLAAFDQYGFYENIFGVPFFLQVRESLFGAWISMTMVNFPFVFLLTYSALINLPGSIEESAQTLGLNRKQIFFRVILPNIKIPIISGMLLIALYSLSDFGTPALMNYKTLTFELYRFWDTGRLSQSSIFCLLLMFIAFVILISESLINRRSHYSLNNKSCRPAAKSGLSLKGKVGVLSFFSSVIFIAILLPFLTIIYWTLQGREKFLLPDNLGDIATNSLVLAGLTAAFALFFALPFSWFAAREKGAFSFAADKISFIGNMIPGAVIALALIGFFVSFRIGEFTLYQTIAMPVLGCTIRFLPQAVSALKTTLVQINPNLEEASMTLGESPGSTFRKVTFPLMSNGMLSAIALVFILTIKELPITLMLSPLGKTYLTGAIWDFIDEAEYSRVAVPALSLLIISAVSLFFILKQNKSRMNA